jgi:hypothetical protein
MKEERVSRRYPHNYHSDHRVGELAWYGHDDLVPWTGEEQLVDLCDHDLEGLES